MKVLRAHSLLLGCLVTLAAPWAEAQLFRPSQEFRSLNTDLFSISIQRNGRVDVAWASGKRIFENVFPMVLFEGEANPVPLDINGRESARTDVNDVLGMGQGLIMETGNCVWSLRVYPSQSIFAVQVAYVNTTKQPKTVASLFPLCTGAPRRGGLTLGGPASSTIIVGNAVGEDGQSRGPSRSWKKSLSQNNVAMFSPIDNTSFVAGFITETSSANWIRVESTEQAGADIFDLVRTECRYDPPRIVQPGEKILSDVLYISAGDDSPLEALHQFFLARSRSYSMEFSRPLEPHQWDYWNTPFRSGNDDNLEKKNCDYQGHPKTQRPQSRSRGGGLSASASILWLTGAAFTGGLENLAQCYPNLSPGERFILNRIEPFPAIPARPVDLFDRDVPQVWTLPLSTMAGDFYLLAMFNWDPADEEVVSVDFARAGLMPDRFYSVYDFWGDRYFGVAQGRLAVDVPPRSVRVFCLRPYQDRPFFLSSDRRITQGAVDLFSMKWDAERNRLSGVLSGEAGQDYTLSFLVPEGFKTRQISLSTDAFNFHWEENVLKIMIRSEEDGPISMTLVFRRES